MTMRIGPDARRYLAAAAGTAVPRPFCWRVALPAICKQDLRRWYAVWFASWVVLAVSCVLWVWQDHAWQRAVAAAVVLCALPGVLGPRAVIPVGVDLPASALTLAGVAMWTTGHGVGYVAAVVVWVAAALIKETSPVWAALWAWTPAPLVCLAAVGVVALFRRPGPDPLGPRFQEIADHPVKTALEAHRGRWRDGWLMVAPWGVGVAALYQIDWQIAIVLLFAYGQMLVATDSVRLYQHGAGPVVAAAAVAAIPVAWLPLVVVLHIVWWRTPERI